MFYERVTEIYDGVKAESSGHDKTVEEILDAKMVIVANIMMLVREKIRRNMAILPPSGDTQIQREAVLSSDKDSILQRVNTIFGGSELQEVQQMEGDVPLQDRNHWMLAFNLVHSLDQPSW